MEKNTYNITGWLIHNVELRTMSMQCVYKCEIVTEFFNKDEMVDMMKIVTKILCKNYTLDKNHILSIDLRHNGKTLLSLLIPDSSYGLRTDLTVWEELKNEK